MTTDSALDGKIVITGGAGLLGSELCHALLAAHSGPIVVIDPRNMSPSRQLPPDGKSFHWLRAPVEASVAQRAMENASCVFHLASSTTMPWSQEEPLRDIHSGFDPTLAVLEVMRISPPRKFIFCSSSAVYGNLASHPVSEDAGPLLPISTYGAAKLAGEGFVSAYASLFGFSALTCRLGNIISEASDRGALLDIARQLLKSNDVCLLGNGDQARTYLGADQAAQALLYLVDVTRAPTGVVNVGGRGLVRTHELVELVARSIGKVPTIRIASTTQEGWVGDLPIVDLNVDELERLGWPPPQSIDVVNRVAKRLIARLSESQCG